MRAALLGLLLLGEGWAGASSRAEWDRAFGDPLGPLSLRATYFGPGGGSHLLEFWRDGEGRVVRRTDGRAELHLSPAPDGEDAYQLRDPARRTAYTVHRSNLPRVGLLTDRWSVQHLLDRPTGVFTLANLGRTQSTPAGECAWWRVTLQGASPNEVCWSGTLGVPLLMTASGRTTFRVEAVSTTNVQLPAAALPEGWREFDADEDLAPD